MTDIEELEKRVRELERKMDDSGLFEWWWRALHIIAEREKEKQKK